MDGKPVKVDVKERRASADSDGDGTEYLVSSVFFVFYLISSLLLSISSLCLHLHNTSTTPFPVFVISRNRDEVDPLASLRVPKLPGLLFFA